MASRRSLVTAAAAAAAALAGVACKGSPSKLDPLLEPPVQTRIALDGEWNEPAWRTVALRGVFVADGAQARPYSEIRLVRDETHLIAALYAADEDIRSDDAFELTAGTLAARVTAAGDARPGTVRAAVDTDGTLDEPHDDDEEWVVELAVPLAALGPSPVTLRASRCDVTKSGARLCGSWQQDVDLKTLPLVR
jgi:hypothetical protein